MKYNQKAISEYSQWDARQGFLSFLLELINDMYLDKKEDNLTAYKISFKQCLILVKPYIAKHFTEDDDVLFSMEDVDSLYNDLKPNTTDTNEKENQFVTGEILTKIEDKEERLYFLLAKEKLLMPMEPKKDIGKSVLEM